MKKISWKANSFIRREDLDFYDEGIHFKGYEYAGVPITYYILDGEYFISIREDYIRTYYTWADWRKTDEYELTDEFDGCCDVDVEKLKSNCVAIAAKVAELNEKAKNEVIDVHPLVNELNEEIKMAEDVVDDFKQNFKWYDCSDYELRSSVGNMKRLMLKIDYMKTLIDELLAGELDNIKIRNMSAKLDEYGYIEIEENNYNIRRLKNALN